MMNYLPRRLALAAAPAFTFALFALFALVVGVMPAATAGTASASFQASLTIVGSCTVNALAARPQVACNYADAYRVDLAPQQAQQPTQHTQRQLGSDGVWTVTF